MSTDRMCTLRSVSLSCGLPVFKGTLVPGNRHAIHEFTDQLWLAYESFITVPNTGPF